jgi:hypothetical protein
VVYTELTDEPCPECGASLDVQVTPPEGLPVMGNKPPDEHKTIELARVRICPECGWQQVETR